MKNTSRLKTDYRKLASVVVMAFAIVGTTWVATNAEARSFLTGTFARTKKVCVKSEVKKPKCSKSQVLVWEQPKCSYRCRSAAKVAQESGVPTRTDSSAQYRLMLAPQGNSGIYHMMCQNLSTWDIDGGFMAFNQLPSYCTPLVPANPYWYKCTNSQLLAACPFK